VATDFTLSGAMIPRSVRRSIDHRAEERVAADPAAGVLVFRGGKHPVRLVNTSNSGAMVIFPLVPNIGEKVRLQTPGGREVAASVVWVRGGRVGIGFEQAPE
jgi:hypothetical protein